MVRNIKTLVLIPLFIWAIAFSGILVYIDHNGTKKGMVTGILYSISDSIEKSSAILNGQIVKEGDIIEEVKIVRIERFTVEFDKNGKRWKQHVREQPNSVWDQP